MTVTVKTFRQSYPEFDDVAYPTSAASYYLSIAGILLSQTRFGVGATTAVSPPTTQYDILTELFVAHHLTLEKRAQDAAKTGGVPGEVQGPVASKSIGPLSVSYDNNAVVNLKAGHWNNSMYGIRFLQLARYFGSGPIQIGIGCDPNPFNSGAWPGPFATPDWVGWN